MEEPDPTEELDPKGLIFSHLLLFFALMSYFQSFTSASG
jgi:hypothetical protein